MVGILARTIGDVLSPSFRQIVLKAVLLAVLVLIAVGAALYQGVGWVLNNGEAWAVATFGPNAAGPAGIVEAIAAIIAGLGLVVGLIFLIPPVSAVVATLFLDDVAAKIETTHYAADPPGRPLPIPTAVWEGLKFFGVVLLVNLAALPTLLIAGAGVIVFFLANAYLLSREFFELAAFRAEGVTAGRARRRAHAGRIFLFGLPIAALAAVPVVNLIVPVFGTTLMVHLHKALAGSPANA